MKRKRYGTHRYPCMNAVIKVAYRGTTIQGRVVFTCYVDDYSSIRVDVEGCHRAAYYSNHLSRWFIPFKPSELTREG